MDNFSFISDLHKNGKLEWQRTLKLFYRNFIKLIFSLAEIARIFLTRMI